MIFIGHGLLSPLMAVVAIFCGIQGVVFSAIGLSQAKRLAIGRRLAWAGLVLGLIAVILVFVGFESAIGPFAI